MLVDAPDIDSLERANRALTDHLVEAADLCLFVTTATRYADRVPWTVLARVRERGLPLQVIVNRMPAEATDQADILADVRRLLAEAGLEEVQSTSGDAPLREVIAVREGAFDASADWLERGTIGPVLDQSDRLRADRQARLELAMRALMGRSRVSAKASTRSPTTPNTSRSISRPSSILPGRSPAMPASTRACPPHRSWRHVSARR